MPYPQGVIYKFRDVQTHQAVPLPPGEYLIGREDDCPICIENTSVSRRHAKITNGEDGLWIEDLGSSNGTAVRGQLITERTAISVGEVIYFGPVCYRLEPEIVGEEAPATVPQPGLKPAGLRNLMRKTTDRVPLGSIRFDHVPASEATTLQSAAPVAVAEPEPVPAPSAARQKISSYPTITLPATRVASSAPASTFTAPTPASVTAAEIPRASAPASISTPSTDEETVTSKGVSTLTIWMAFGAGVGVGLLLGIGIAYMLFTLGRVSS